MAIAESILPEFDHETATTRTLLERVPADKAEWKPHVKSMSLGRLAMHIANLPHWASITLERTEFDTNPPDGPRATTPAYESAAKLLQTYDANVSAARVLLVRSTDAEFMVQWTLKNGGKSMFSMPRVAVFRSFVLNHAVHHRGQLSVYLRLLDVPIPNIYGPTADTQS
jgi:uncharacterized damage-inducible protein DinB